MNTYLDELREDAENERNELQIAREMASRRGDEQAPAPRLGCDVCGTEDSGRFDPCSTICVDCKYDLEMERHAQHEAGTDQLP